MKCITNTILFPISIPNPHYKKYLKGWVTLILITPNHPNRYVSWKHNQKIDEAAICIATMLQGWAECMFIFNL